MIHAIFDPSTLGRMQRVIDAWQSVGAKFVSLPWVAPAAVVQSTRPDWAQGQDVDTPHGQLLASGEQAFLWWAQEQWLRKPGLYIGWTPCFRDEVVFSELHHYAFLKAEVFAWGFNADQASTEVRHLAEQARAILASESPGALDISENEEGGLDIYLGEIELGSYGWRNIPGTDQVYAFATALAEPRFTEAVRAWRRQYLDPIENPL